VYASKWCENVGLHQIGAMSALQYRDCTMTVLAWVQCVDVGTLMYARFLRQSRVGKGIDAAWFIPGTEAAFTVAIDSQPVGIRQQDRRPAKTARQLGRSGSTTFGWRQRSPKSLNQEKRL
jgi:hypothetical protein